MTKEEKEQELLNILKLVSPGTPLRSAIDDVAKAELGALIVLSDNPEVLNLINGGFEVNCKFSPQRLAELCKMDGAIILDSDSKKVLFANTLLVPDHTIPTNETGTRHKAAERMAKQTSQVVIAVSERKHNVTIYKGSIKYSLRPMQEILHRADETLRMLEKHKDIFNELLSNLNLLEFTNLTTLNDVVLSIQRAEIIGKLEEIIMRYIIELGIESSLVRIQLKEITKGISNEEMLLIKDYSLKDIFPAKVALSELSLDQLLEPDVVMKVLGYQKSDDKVSTKGYRLLNKTRLTSNEIDIIVENLKSLQLFFDPNLQEKVASLIGEKKLASLTKELAQLRENVLLGKKI